MAALALPALADGRLAAARHAFSTPERIPLSAADRAALQGAAEPPLRHEGHKLARWTLGSGPRVILVHGWNSRGAHLLALARGFVEAGFSATLFDLPAHGDSGGHAASVVHAARALRAIAADLGDVHAIVGHSMGSAAALLAFAHGLRVRRSVHLAGPSSLTPMVRGLAGAQGLGPGDAAAFAGWVEAFIGTRMGCVDLERLTPGLRHPALIVHDPEDRTVPFAASAELHAAWPGSRLDVVTGLGHRRLPADADVIARSVAFVADGRGAVSAPARPPEGPLASPWRDPRSGGCISEPRPAARRFSLPPGGTAHRTRGAPVSAAPRRWLLTLAALSALATLSTNLLLPALPDLARAMGGTETALTAAVLGVFLFVFAFAQLVVGPLSDRLGRRPVVLAGLGVFVAGSGLCAVAASLPVLLAGRALQGAGVAAASVLARAAARDRFEGAPLAALLGRIMVVMAAAPGFAPLLGSLVHAARGWRALFVVMMLAGLALAVAHARIVGETLPPARRSRQAVGALARGYVGLLGDARFARPALATAAILGALFAFFGTAPLVLARDFGFSGLQVGLFFAASVFVVFAAGAAAARWTPRRGAAAVLRAGAALALLGGLGMLAAGGAGLAGFALAAGLFLFGMGLVSPTGTALALTPFAAQAGQASALLGFLQMAAAAGLTTAAAMLPGARVDALACVLAGGGLAALCCTLDRAGAAAARPAARP